jgi:hypothetical protein
VGIVLSFFDFGGGGNGKLTKAMNLPHTICTLSSIDSVTIDLILLSQAQLK